MIFLRKFRNFIVERGHKDYLDRSQFKVMSPPSHESSSLHIFFLSATAAIGGFLFGFDSGVINGTVDALQKAFDASSLGSGFNVASMLLGCAAGAFMAGNLADRFGRKSVMIVTALLFMLSAWGSGVAASSGEFIAYRIIGGLAVGAASVICPAYISEIAPAHVRGRLASLQQLAIVLGLFMAFLSNYIIAQAAGTASATFWWGFEAWQWMFWMEMAPAIIFFGALIFIPESPRFLVAAGRDALAAKVIARLNPAIDPARKVADIRETLTEGHRPSIKDLWDSKAKKIHPILWVGVGLASFQQFVGINVVFYYGATLWQAAGFSEADALLINVIGGAVNIGSTLVAIALVDKLGRKPLLVFGSVGMALTLGTLAWTFSMSASAADGQLELTGSGGIIALIAANLYVMCFGISWGPVMWVMLGEMFRNQFRGAALAVSGFVQWTSNFVITMTFPVLLASIGLGGAYGMYTLFAVLSIFFVVLYVRETRGKTLEQM